MSEIEAFFRMGGYAFYVWTSYGLAAIILIANVVVPWLQGRRVREALRRQLERRSKAESNQPPATPSIQSRTPQ